MKTRRESYSFIGDIYLFMLTEQ